MANISSEEFQKYWRVVEKMIPDEELLCMFEKASSTHDNLAGKVDFINNILRRYKAMGEPVSYFWLCLFFFYGV